MITYTISRCNTLTPSLQTDSVDLALDTGMALSVTLWDDGTMVKAWDGDGRQSRSVHFWHGHIVFVLDWEEWSANGSPIGIATRSLDVNGIPEEW